MAAVGLAPDLAARVDASADAMRDRYPGLGTTRSAAIRTLVVLGLEAGHAGGSR